MLHSSSSAKLPAPDRCVGLYRPGVGASNRHGSRARPQCRPKAALCHGTVADCGPIYCRRVGPAYRSEEHTSELQSLMRISYAVFCLKKKKPPIDTYLHLSSHMNTTHIKTTH